MSEPETLPEMAERLHGNLYLDSPNVDQQRHNIGLIHAALREVEKLAMTHVIVSTAPVVGDWQRRAEKAEAENARLMEALVAAGEAYDVALVRAERFRDMHAALVQAESYLSLLRFRGGVRWKQQGSAFGVDVDEVDEAISLSRAALATPAEEPKP